MLLAFNYCCDVFRPQLLAIFRELNVFYVCSLYVNLYVRESTYVFKIIINVKNLEISLWLNTI